MTAKNSPRKTVASVSNEVAELRSELADVKALLSQAVANMDAIAASVVQVQAKPEPQARKTTRRQPKADDTGSVKYPTSWGIPKLNPKGLTAKQIAYRQGKIATLADQMGRAAESGKIYQVAGHAVGMYHQGDYTWIVVPTISGYDDPMLAAIRDTSYLGGRWAKRRQAHNVQSKLEFADARKQLAAAAKAHGVNRKS